jgi:23S rRNA-/tRNA-specific pseudouridylate synthase
MVRVVLPAEKKHRFTRKASPDTYTTEAETVARSGNFVLVRAHLTRGFRHQVRAHLAFLGFPIIGDPLYGIPVPPGFPERMYLHASQIKLIHPGSDQPLIIKSPLPSEFKAIFPEFTSKIKPLKNMQKSS